MLALDYMKRTKKLTPEVHAKAEGFIANGYQRLLTFEVPGGGFSWFGNPPANKILTSYGLMEFSDMSKVHDVDPKLIERTQQWLAGQQQADGSWKPDTSFINEGATNRYNTDVLRITAYIGWALENTGYQGPAVEKAQQFVEQHMGGEDADTYTLAVLANFAADYGKDREFTRAARCSRCSTRVPKKTSRRGGPRRRPASTRPARAPAWRPPASPCRRCSSGARRPQTAGKALAYIAAKKDASGTWGTTQATIMALRALLLSTEKGAADVRGTVEVSLNGKTVETLTLTPENNDLLHQFVFKNVDASGPTRWNCASRARAAWPIRSWAGYFLPWDESRRTSRSPSV